MASRMSSPLPARPVDVGGWLCSSSSLYRVESFLGEGTFGKVAKCTRMEDQKSVAIKMMQNQGALVYQARAEVAALMKLKTLDPDKCNIVRWYQVFTSRGHNCLEFEQLDKSLRDLVEERCLEPLLLKEIRPVVQQLATALNHLKSVGILHADLKLENVVLVNHVQEPYRVKLIDFGLADEVSAARVGSYIQTLPYRSPEIILGLPYTEAIDMWSLGCIAAELYLGFLLYPGFSEYDMIRFITQTQGMPPQDLLSLGTKTEQFFQRDKTSTTGLWKLKTPEQFQAETGIESLETQFLRLWSLYDLLHINVKKPKNPADKAAERKDRQMFVGMLRGMLELDAARRITPQQVLQHPFITMKHMSSMDPLNSHIRSCFKLMDVCRRETQISGSGTAVGGSPKPSSSSRTTCTVQQNLSQPNNSPDPCSGTQTSRSVRSGVKRRADEEDDEINETSHSSKRIRCEWHSSSSSSSSSQDPVSSNHTQSDIRPGTKKRKACPDSEVDSDRSDSDRKSFRRSSSSSSSSSTSPSSQTESRAQSGLKRKAEDDEDDALQRTSDMKRRRKMRGGGEVHYIERCS